MYIRQQALYLWPWTLADIITLEGADCRCHNLIWVKKPPQVNSKSGNKYINTHDMLCRFQLSLLSGILIQQKSVATYKQVQVPAINHFVRIFFGGEFQALQFYIACTVMHSLLPDISLAQLLLVVLSLCSEMQTIADRTMQQDNRYQQVDYQWSWSNSANMDTTSPLYRLEQLVGRSEVSPTTLTATLSL